jgi:DNA-binding LacI/PurR family transcriptional regulator
VPGHLRIAGCTDSEASRQARPALTALSLDPTRLGRDAVDLLLSLVEDGDPGECQRVVPHTIVPRASTGG